MFKINVLDSFYEGILWVKFQCHDDANMCSLVCICYLPPSTSSRGDSSKELFDRLGCQYLLYSALGPFVYVVISIQVMVTIRMF